MKQPLPRLWIRSLRVLQDFELKHRKKMTKGQTRFILEHISIILATEPRDDDEFLCPGSDAWTGVDVLLVKPSDPSRTING
jgi:hypothetical protein